MVVVVVVVVVVASVLVETVASTHPFLQRLLLAVSACWVVGRLAVWPFGRLAVWPVGQLGGYYEYY